MGDRVFDPRRGLALHVPQGRPQTTEVAQAGRRNWQTWQTHALGANSLLAKAGEHVPLLADGLVCLHKYRGQTEAEERARAFSLQKHLSKDGALTKLAELLPGSNLLAAAMLHIRGHHREAQEALNLLKNWRDCGSADGALAKVAEMLPGVDVIAFGVHVNAGNFAQALRSISKTQWTDVTGDVIISFDLATLHGFSVSDIQASNLEVIPVASFMYGGLLDIVTNLIEVNSRGQKRSRFLRAAASSTTPVHRVKETLLGCCNEVLEDLTQETLPEMIPELLDSAAMAATSYFQSQKGYMSFLLPKALPAKQQELEKEFQRSLEKVTVCHKRAIPVEVLRQKEIGKFGSAEVIATSTCCLGLGLHSVGLACVAGCFCGFSQLRRWLQRQFVPLVNSQNEQAWNDATKEPTQVFIRRPSPMEPEKSESQPSDRKVRMPFALIAELHGEPAERLTAALGRYFCQEMPLMKLLGHRGFHLLQRWMMGLLTQSIDGVPVVPLVLHAEVGEGLYSICGQSLWLPSVSFAVVLECHLSAEPFVSTIQIVVTDDLVDQVLDVLQTGIRGIDLRQLDTRLAGFAEPINLYCKALLSWPQASSPRLDLRDIKIHLQLPS